MQRYDVIVLGGGVMGAAATWALARRGRRVLMLERFEPGHARGSSHSSARIFRLGYEEGDYIRLGRRALPLWRMLEDDSGATLLELTGALDHGPRWAVAPLAQALEADGVPHRWLTAGDAAARWPGIRFDEAVLQHPDGGRLYAQRSVDVLHQAARRHGAVLRFATRARAVAEHGDGIQVHLADGELLAADRLVVTAGAWTSSIVGDLLPLPPLQVSCENPMHFRQRDPAAAVQLPLIHRGTHDMYSLGIPGEGVKVSEHYRDEWIDPDDRPFDIDPASAARVAAYIREWLPGLDPSPVSSVRCLYTTTPTKDFVLDRQGRIAVGAGFSGHGFKFAPAVGEVLADLAEGAVQPVDRFRLQPRDPQPHVGLK